MELDGLLASGQSPLLVFERGTHGTLKRVLVAARRSNELSTRDMARLGHQVAGPPVTYFLCWNRTASCFGFQLLVMVLCCCRLAQALALLQVLVLVALFVLMLLLLLLLVLLLLVQLLYCLCRCRWCWC
jgi:hypothetical protein